MAKTFDNYPALTCKLAFELIDRLGGRDRLQAEFGKSNQSCSAYVKLAVLDEDGDWIDEDHEFKVRFSDHADRYGSDITILINDLVEAVEEDGEYLHITIEDWKYEAALERAMTRVDAFIAELAA